MITVVEVCGHRYTRVTQFCGSCREVTWSQLRGRGGILLES